MAKQMQYSGWSSKAEAASLHKWTKAEHLVDTIRRIQDKDLSAAKKLVYYKQELSRLKCFSFSQTRRFPNVWAVKISEGEIKSDLDKVELLADEISAVVAANDAQRAVVIDNNGNGNGSWTDDLLYLHIKESNDASKALDAAFDSLYRISEVVLEDQYSTTWRDELEKELGITWQRGPRRT